MQEISEEEFHRAMAGIKEFRETIGRFESREECLSYLSKATRLSREECGAAYDLYIKMDLSAFAGETDKNKGEEK